MDTYELPIDLRSLRLRTARQKKRLQKEDFDKQLIQVYLKRKELNESIRNLPMVPLAVPYQKGWMRTFVLREDVKHSKYAGFYEQLLAKINTIKYSNDRHFKKKKRKHRKTIYVDTPQSLIMFDERAWNHPKLNLTEHERLFFIPQTFWNPNLKRFEVKYVFSEPWRYVLKVKPYMITKVKLLDANLEGELNKLDDYLDGNNLQGRMWVLVNGRRQSIWNEWYGEKEKYRNPLKNKPIHRILNEYAGENY